jgi:hypothetical protein
LQISGAEELRDVDLINNRAIVWNDDFGMTFNEDSIPEDMLSSRVESICLGCDYDESLMEG